MPSEKENIFTLGYDRQHFLPDFVPEKHKRFIYKYWDEIAALVVLGIALLFFSYLRAPGAFPVGSLVTIPSETTLSEISEQFEDRRIISSAFMLNTLVKLIGAEKGVIAGDYLFERRLNVFEITNKITQGEFGLEPIRITIPEGVTVKEMADLYQGRFPKFDSEHFIEEALPLEGYLFPDTYFFLLNVSEEEVIRVMKDTFIRRVSEIDSLLESSDRSLEEVVIMASLLEEEARNFETRQMIAGILWKRLDIGMPLQVDAVFPYIIGRNTFELTLDDLDYDSPYNTYKYKGLPIGPITNPGLESLKAAVTPIETDFLFYLSDFDGEMHYAETFERHKNNKFKYLR